MAGGKTLPKGSYTSETRFQAGNTNNEPENKRKAWRWWYPSPTAILPPLPGRESYSLGVRFHHVTHFHQWMRQQWSGRSSRGVLFFSGLTFPLPLWPACLREAGPATRGEWDNTVTAQPPWGISLCSLRRWDMKALRRMRRRTQKDKRWTKGNCVTKVHISEPGERSQECQLLKAMEPEKTMWALLILYRAHSAEVGVKVRRQGLVSVQMHGNENSDAENYLKTFRASES